MTDDHAPLPDRLADSLRDLGYDIEPAQPGVPRGASLVARRDLGDQAVVIALDAGGRFRIDLTWTVGEWAARDSLAGTPVRVVETVSRSTNVVGHVTQPDELLRVVSALADLVDWAAPVAPSGPTATDVPPPP